MATLPYSRVVDVNLTRQDNFPTRAGFGVPLILSDTQSAGNVDGTTPVKTYGTLAEVEADWPIASATYVTAQAVFSQNPTPNQIKIGDMSTAADAVTVVTAAGLIEAFDDGFYWMIPTAALFDASADQATMVALAQFVETRTKLLILHSDDANTESQADTTNVAKLLQDLELSRTTVAYHDLGDQLQAGIAAYGATRNFDDAGSGYTMKFKNLSGIRSVDRTSSVIQAITGFVPNLGLDATQGFFANTYVNVGGATFVTEGSMADGGFIDEVHFQDWLIARTQEEMLAVFLNNARVPYSDRGVNLLVQAVQRVLTRARAAGLIIDYEDTNGDVRRWDINVPRVADVAESQRRQRIAPAIAVTFRYAGAIHYATVNYTMTF